MYSVLFGKKVNTYTIIILTVDGEITYLYPWFTNLRLEFCIMHSVACASDKCFAAQPALYLRVSFPVENERGEVTLHIQTDIVILPHMLRPLLLKTRPPWAKRRNFDIKTCPATLTEVLTLQKSHQQLSQFQEKKLNSKWMIIHIFSNIDRVIIPFRVPWSILTFLFDQ